MNPITRFKSVLTLTLLTCSGLIPSWAADASKPEDAPVLRQLNMKVDKNRMKSFSESSTIIIPTVYLKLAIAGKVTAVKQGSALSTIGGGSANTVRASANYTVTGLDKKFAQQLATKVYDDLVAKLREAGYTVKTYADIKDLDVVKSAARETPDATWGMPLEKNIPGGSDMMVLAAPSDEQVFKSGLVGGVFNQFMKAGKGKIADGTVVIPTYVINAPQAWGETGEGYSTISAKANVGPGMNLTTAIAPLITAKGSWGDVRSKGIAVGISSKVGEITTVDKTDKVGNAFSSALSALSGAGKISGSRTEYELKIDPAAYEAGLMNGVTAFNTEVAKAAAEVKK